MAYVSLMNIKSFLKKNVAKGAWYLFLLLIISSCSERVFTVFINGKVSPEIFTQIQSIQYSLRDNSSRPKYFVFQRIDLNKKIKYPLSKEFIYNNESILTQGSAQYLDSNQIQNEIVLIRNSNRETIDTILVFPYIDSTAVKTIGKTYSMFKKKHENIAIYLNVVLIEECPKEFF